MEWRVSLLNILFLSLALFYGWICVPMKWSFKFFLEPQVLKSCLLVELKMGSSLLLGNRMFEMGTWKFELQLPYMRTLQIVYILLYTLVVIFLLGFIY